MTINTLIETGDFKYLNGRLSTREKKNLSLIYNHHKSMSMNGKLILISYANSCVFIFNSTRRFLTAQEEF